MEQYRIFTGIALPAAYQQALADLRASQSGGDRDGVRWTRPGNWHLTLKFLGDVPLTGPRGLEAVKTALAEVRFAPFVLSGQGGGFFPNARRPRVAWLGLGQGGDACIRLASAVEAALAPLGYPPEDRPFAAHLTVARLRALSLGQISFLERALAAVDLPAVTVDALTLWRSVLGPHGPRYSILATFSANQA